MPNTKKVIPHKELLKRIKEKRAEQEGWDFYDEVMEGIRQKRRIIDREMDLIEHKMNRVQKMEKECGELLKFSNNLRKEQADK